MKLACACVRVYVRACVHNQKIFLTKKIFEQKNFWPKKIFFDQIFVHQKSPPKSLWPKKIFFNKFYFYTNIFFTKKTKRKHFLCLNIDITKTSTALASDIPWGPLNIDRTA